MLRIYAITLLISLLIACSDGGKGLFTSAELEEKQNNPAHAAELYKEIIEKHPGSEYASRAKVRLESLGKGQ